MHRQFIRKCFQKYQGTFNKIGIIAKKLRAIIIPTDTVQTIFKLMEELNILWLFEFMPDQLNASSVSSGQKEN